MPKACNSRRTLNGTTKPSRSPVVDHLVFDVYPMLPHGSESGFRLEDGTFTLVPRYPFHHALRLCLQEVAECALSIADFHI